MITERQSLFNRVVIASDHAGFELKESIRDFLKDSGLSIEDVGTYDSRPVDYPDYAAKAARKVASGEADCAIICCGTGQGDAMVANKVPGVRAALCHDVTSAKLSRAHNDANVLVLGEWMIGKHLAFEIIRTWLETPFSGGRHLRRLEKMHAVEVQGRLKRGVLYDVTLSIEAGMLTWPGDSAVEVSQVMSVAEGDAYTASRVSFSTHTGSHIDAPAHFIVGGATVDRIDPEVLIGKARLCQLPGITEITREVLEPLDIEGEERLLLGTDNSLLLHSREFARKYTYLSADAALYLVDIGVRLVGLDYLSVDRYGDNTPAHKTLLGAGVVIVESIDLGGIPPGEYELICLPLKLAGADGAPARVLLRGF